MPALSDINIGEITEIWHYSFTIEVKSSEDDYVIQYIGPELAGILGEDYTGELLQVALEDSPVLVNTIGFYQKVVEARTPVSEASSFYLDGKEGKYRSLIVPLSSDGKTIDYLFGTTNYKMF